MEMLIAGTVSALGMIFLILKLDLQKVCGYDFFIDVGFTFLLAWMFSGTYSGMMAAIIGGVIVSVFLFTVKKVNGYKRLKIVNRKLVWRKYNG
jgi:hypothetical protein